jgi:hypothetical protein
VEIEVVHSSGAYLADKWVTIGGLQTSGFFLLIGVLGQKKEQLFGLVTAGVSSQWVHGTGTGNAEWAIAAASDKGEVGREAGCPSQTKRVWHQSAVARGRAAQRIGS